MFPYKWRFNTEDSHSYPPVSSFPTLVGTYRGNFKRHLPRFFQVTLQINFELCLARKTFDLIGIENSIEIQAFTEDQFIFNFIQKIWKCNAISLKMGNSRVGYLAKKKKKKLSYDGREKNTLQHIPYTKRILDLIM